MPPKKKEKGPIQTKLSFTRTPGTNSKSLMTLELPSSPLNPLSSNQVNSNSTNAASTTTTSTSIATNVRTASQLNSIRQTRPHSQSEQLPHFGGKEINGTINDNDNDTFSTRELAYSISISESNLPPSAVKTPISPQSPMETKESLDKNNSTDTIDKSQTSIDSRKRAATPIDLSEKENAGERSFVDFDSDSDDELLRMPKPITLTHQERSSSTTDSISTPSLPSNSSGAGTKPVQVSLIDQMSTPRGTKPLPRTTETLNARKLSNYSRAPIRPTLSSSSSTISDDGFTSGSSLDSKMQRFTGSNEPEMALPLSQNSSQPSPPQVNISIQAKVQSYSQKRSGDFANYSSSSNKKRVIPLTLAGHKAVPTGQNATMASLSRSNSFEKGAASSFSNSSGFSPASRISQSNSSPQPTPTNESTAQTKGLTKDGLVLSDEQEYVIQQVLLYHRNVFFTGSAGTGKSVLLRELILQLRNKFKNNNRGYDSQGEAVAVTASTGIAACNIGGCTLHSFAGVGLGAEGLPALQAKIRKNPNTVRRWQDTKVLIVDEVSMVEAGFMEKLEALARFVRRNDSPWGGMQVVLTGDFFQLPPVNKSGNVKFCFEGEFWSRTISETIQLKQVFRQKDQTFANMLNEMRLGQMTEATQQKFRTLTRDLKTNDGLRPTELFPLRNQVDEANKRMLNNLPGKIVTYHARDTGPQKEKMEQNCLAPTVLQLKVNSQVMLLRNQGGGSGGLVNGSIGILIGFVTSTADNDNQLGSSGERKGTLNKPGEELPLVRFTLEGGATRDMVVGREEWRIELPNGDLQGSRVQIPLGLAWSLSIHKSQGQTLPKVRVDLGRVFEKGQAYVALSRATSLEGLQVLNFDPRKVMVHPKVTEFYANLRVYKKGQVV